MSVPSINWPSNGRGRTVQSVHMPAEESDTALRRLSNISINWPLGLNTTDIPKNDGGCAPRGILYLGLMNTIMRHLEVERCHEG